MKKSFNTKYYYYIKFANHLIYYINIILNQNFSFCRTLLINHNLVGSIYMLH